MGRNKKDAIIIGEPATCGTCRCFMPAASNSTTGLCLHGPPMPGHSSLPRATPGLSTLWPGFCFQWKPKSGEPLTVGADGTIQPESLEVGTFNIPSGN